MIFTVAIMDERHCTDCKRTLAPGLGRKRCNTCRVKDLCACGGLKQRVSKRREACRRRSEAGEANGNWRGGTTRHKAGYIMRMARGHPRAGKAGYVFEHILVMEEMLGPYLLASETVHHLNGVKDDNRPENLELWTRPQPAGIRATDAVAWARDILQPYQGLGERTALTDQDP
jgi:hypothetical protein